MRFIYSTSLFGILFLVSSFTSSEARASFLFDELLNSSNSVVAGSEYDLQSINQLFASYLVDSETRMTSSLESDELEKIARNYNRWARLAALGSDPSNDLREKLRMLLGDDVSEEQLAKLMEDKEFIQGLEGLVQGEGAEVNGSNLSGETLRQLVASSNSRNNIGLGENALSNIGANHSNLQIPDLASAVSKHNHGSEWNEGDIGRIAVGESRATFSNDLIASLAPADSDTKFDFDQALEDVYRKETGEWQFGADGKPILGANGQPYDAPYKQIDNPQIGTIDPSSLDERLRNQASSDSFRIPASRDENELTAALSPEHSGDGSSHTEGSSHNGNDSANSGGLGNSGYKLSKPGSDDSGGGGSNRPDSGKETPGNDVKPNGLGPSPLANNGGGSQETPLGANTSSDNGIWGPQQGYAEPDTAAISKDDIQDFRDNFTYAANQAGVDTTSEKFKTELTEETNRFIRENDSALGQRVESIAAQDIQKHEQETGRAATAEDKRKITENAQKSAAPTEATRTPNEAEELCKATIRPIFEGPDNVRNFPIQFEGKKDIYVSEKLGKALMLATAYECTGADCGKDYLKRQEEMVNKVLSTTIDHSEENFCEKVKNATHEEKKEMIDKVFAAATSQLIADSQHKNISNLENKEDASSRIAAWQKTSAELVDAQLKNEETTQIQQALNNVNSGLSSGRSTTSALGYLDNLSDELASSPEPSRNALAPHIRSFVNETRRRNNQILSYKSQNALETADPLSSCSDAMVEDFLSNNIFGLYHGRAAQVAMHVQANNISSNFWEAEEQKTQQAIVNLDRARANVKPKLAALLKTSPKLQSEEDIKSFCQNLEKITTLMSPYPTLDLSTLEAEERNKLIEQTAIVYGMRMNIYAEHLKLLKNDNGKVSCNFRDKPLAQMGQSEAENYAKDVVRIIDASSSVLNGLSGTPSSRSPASATNAGASLSLSDASRGMNAPFRQQFIQQHASNPFIKDTMLCIAQHGSRAFNHEYLGASDTGKITGGTQFQSEVAQELRAFYSDYSTMGDTGVQHSNPIAK